MIEDIEEIVENVSSNTSIYKTLQAQLFQVRYRADDIVGILGSEINSLYVDQELEWSSSSLGVSIYNSSSRKWTQFTFPQDMTFNDFESYNTSTSNCLPSIPRIFILISGSSQESDMISSRLIRLTSP